ncbi:MAG: hypothetical protein AAFR39_13995 [Pseudomonadota bacterium]
MRTMTSTLLVSISAITLSGCTQIFQANDGVTFGAGNAVAHNTALQVVDPWPGGVQDTNLIVPANRGGGTAGTGVAPTPPAPAPAPADPAADDS